MVWTVASVASSSSSSSSSASASASARYALEHVMAGAVVSRP